jgi:spermidine synthase
MAFRARSTLFSLLVYLAFFASGAGSLIAEVTWNRMLIVVVGNSLSATALIIVVFMGGLGLGSYAGGKVFGSRPPTLLPYVLMEVAVGTYVLLSPTLFDILAGLFTSLADSVGNRALLTGMRLLVSVAALFLPSFLMGATFPAMISAAAPDSPRRRTARTGYLYGVNTVGAAVGCFAAGYHLLLEFGVRFTLWCAFGLYILAALCALVASRFSKTSAPDEAPALDGDEPRETAPAAPSGRLVGILYAGTFAIGFVSLAYEVLLTRVSILYLGNGVSIFPLVLTGFLLGTGCSAVLGTWLYGILHRRGRRADDLFGFTALVSGVAIFATPYLLLSGLVLKMNLFGRTALSDTAPRNPLPLLGLVVAPTLLVGALLPVAIRMLQRAESGPATRAAATLYTLNTLGGLLGAGLANHFLVPLIGVQGVLLLLTLLCFAVGLSLLVGPARNVSRTLLGAIGLVVVLSAASFSLPSLVDLYAAKIAAATGARSTDIRLIREGRAATVTVLDQEDPRLGTYRDMYLNGVEEASTRYWHTQLFKLLGIFPVLLHESLGPKNVLVIAFGAGITAGSVLASDQVASLDVVDLNPDIRGINDLFKEVNGDVYHQPRFRFHNDDGRNFLVTHGGRFDLIISDSTHPRAYDSWILYTEEFYRAVQRRLKPGGIFAQWVPVHGSMQGSLMRIHLNTFRKVFPHATFWYVYGSDQAFLLATPEPLAIDAPGLQRKLDRLPEWFRSREYQIDTVARVAGFFWMDESAMARMIGGETRINTDQEHFFDKQSALWPLPPEQQLPAYQTGVLPFLRSADAAVRAAAGDQQRVARALGRYGFYRSTNDLYDAYCFMPENGDVRYFMAREFADKLPDHETFCRARDMEFYRGVVARHPDNIVALNGLADLLRESGDLDQALALIEKAYALEPKNGMVLDTYGLILFHRREIEKAIDLLERSAALLPDHPVVLYHLGAAHQAAGHVGVARRHLEKALAVSSSFDGADEAKRLLQRMP